MVDDILVRAMLYAQLDAIDKPPTDEPWPFQMAASMHSARAHHR